MGANFIFSVTLLLVPFYVKCDFTQWHHLSVPHNNDYPEDLCFDNSNCASGKHCVDNECRCIGSENALYVGKTCYKEKNYGEKCELHIQCPLFERCVNNTCQCAEGYVATMWEGCQPESKLDDICLVDEQCITAHTACIDNRCRCSTGYGESTRNTCEPEFTTVRVYIIASDGQEADPNDETLHMVARELGHSRANENTLKTKEITHKNPRLKSEKKLRKKRSLFDLNNRITSILKNVKIPGVNNGDVNTRPVPKLDQRCDRHSDCSTVKNALCKHKSCKCKPGYVKKNKNNKLCFLESSIGQSCSFPEQCPANAFCSGTCQCSSNNIKLSSRICAPVKKLGEYCKYSPQCTVNNINSVCSRGHCQCKWKYVEYDLLCMQQKSLSKACQHSIQCPVNADCNNKVCECKSGYLYIDNIGCLPELNLDEICLYSEQCESKVSNSECNEGSKCDCKAGHVRNGNACIRSAGLGESCDSSDHCEDQNAICGTDKKCTCDNNFYECLNSCFAGQPLGEVCTCSAQCTTPNSQCSSTCKCQRDYIQCSESCLPKKTIGEHCTCDDQCTMANAICYRREKCWCKDGYQHYKGQCRPKTLGKSCVAQGACTSNDLFSECQRNTCKCSSKYAKNAQEHCQANTASLGGSCTFTGECKRSDRYSTCGTNGRCQCSPSFINVRGVCTKKVSAVGRSCSTCIECVRGNRGTTCNAAGKCACSDVMGTTPDPRYVNRCNRKECGATYSSVSSKTTIKSPSLPDGYYWNNAACLWRFTTTFTAFKIEIVYFATETMDYPDLCLLDYVKLTNNNGCSINLCGDYDAGTTVFITGNNIEISFLSNEKFRKRGFEFNITPVDASTISSSCNVPDRNRDALSWMDEECCHDPADDVNFETQVLRGIFPQWYTT